MFEQDFIEFVEFLNKHQVKYMVVGAYALSFHGRPRHTGDLDIWIKPDAENARKMVKAITDFGFDQLGLPGLFPMRKLCYTIGLSFVAHKDP